MEERMNRQKFWVVFIGAQVVGLFLAMSGVLIHFYTVILGMFLLFPGIILTSSLAISQTPWIVLVAAILTMTINVPFWITLFKPAPARAVSR